MAARRDDNTSVTGDDLNAQIHKRRRAVSVHLDKAGLFGYLNGPQREQLTDIVFRFHYSFQMYRWLTRRMPDDSQPFTNSDLRADEKFGPAQRRMFSQKVQTALDAVQDALEYATDDRKTRVYGRALKAFAVEALEVAQAQLEEALDWNRMVHSAQPVKVSDPTTEANETLIAFFEGFGVQTAEALRLTAEIFTQFKWGKSDTTGTKAAAAMPRAKDAVRKRHDRAKRR